MGKKLDAATQGRIKFQMFPGSVLGAEKEMIEQTQVGAIHVLRTSLGPVGPVVPEVNVFNMPFVFRSVAHMRAVIDGPIGQELLDKISASPARMVGLAWMDGGSRSLYTKKPVRKPEDLKGQKIRMMGNPLFVDTMNAMGGNGIAMGYGEVFTAIQTGVIDGAETVSYTHLDVYKRQAQLARDGANPRDDLEGSFEQACERVPDRAGHAAEEGQAERHIGHHLHGGSACLVEDAHGHPRHDVHGEHQQHRGQPLPARSFSGAKV